MGTKVRLLVTILTVTQYAGAVDPTYTIQDLGPLGVPPGLYFPFMGINNHGQVTGSFHLDGTPRAFFWNGTTLVDIGDLGGGLSYGYGINSAGHITGISRAFLDGPSRAFLWDGTTMKDIGALTDSPGAYGAGINDSEKITGTDLLTPHAFLWTPGASPILPYSTLSLSISSAGVIPGFGVTCTGTDATAYLIYRVYPYSYSPGNIRRAPCVAGLATFQSFDLSAYISNFGQYPSWLTNIRLPLNLYVKNTTGLYAPNGDYTIPINLSGAFNNYNPSAYSPDDNTWPTLAGGPQFTFGGTNWTNYAYASGTMRDIGGLGGQPSFGAGVNNHDQITGRSYVYDPSSFQFQNHAFFWNGTTMVDLGTLGKLDSFGAAINDAGHIAGVHGGSFNPATAPSHGFLWNGTTMVDIGTLFEFSSAFGINNLDQIVGATFGDAFNPTSHGFFWDGTHMWDLNNQVTNLGAWTELTAAVAINDSGQIAGSGTLNGQTHAFLLTPVGLGGTISVTTNVSSATFSITGPANYAGSGTSFTQTNAPTGTYTIRFGAVAGYATPASQKFVLASGTTIPFNGVYQPLVSANPPTLSFQYAPGVNDFTRSQQLSIVSPSLLPFTVSIVTSPPGGTWLSLSESFGMASPTGANIAVSVSPHMKAGSYFATAVILAPSAGNTTLNVPISLIVAAQAGGQPTQGQKATLTVVTNTGTLVNHATFTIFDAAGHALPDAINVPSYGPTGVRPGPYSVLYNPLPGYYTPLVQHLNLTQGASPSLTGKYRRLILVSFTGYDNAPTPSNCFPSLSNPFLSVGSGIQYETSNWGNSTAGMIKLLYEIQHGATALSIGADMAGFTFYSTDGNRNQLGDACTPDNATGKTVADAPHAEAHNWIESQKITPDDLIAVMGHSYGGNRARRFVDELDSAGVVVTFLATIDPIDWDKCNGKTFLFGCDQSQLSYPFHAVSALSFHQLLGESFDGLVPLKGYVLDFPAIVGLQPDYHREIDDDFIVHTNIKTSLLSLVNAFLQLDAGAH